MPDRLPQGPTCTGWLRCTCDAWHVCAISGRHPSGEAPPDTRGYRQDRGQCATDANTSTPRQWLTITPVRGMLQRKNKNTRSTRVQRPTAHRVADVPWLVVRLVAVGDERARTAIYGCGLAQQLARVVVVSVCMRNDSEVGQRQTSGAILEFKID